MKNDTDITLSTARLTVPQNTALKQEIHAHTDTVSRTAALLLRYRDGEGWKLDGYSSFNEAAPLVWPKLFGSTSQLYRLLDRAEVERNTGKTVPILVAQELSCLPAAEQAPALEEATAASPAGKVTVAAAKTAVGKRQPAEKPATPKKGDTRFDDAMLRLEDLCGKKVANSIRDGSLSNVNRKSAIFWADLKDTEAESLHELVVTKRWTPEKAHKFLSKAPGEKSTVADLQLLAISQDGATSVMAGGFFVVCINWRSKQKEYAKIKEILGL